MLHLLLQPLHAAAMHQHGAEGSPPMGAWLILTESGCPAARGFAIAEPVARYDCGVLRASIAHTGLHCTCISALHTQGCIAHAYLHCTYGAAFHIWGCIACTENSCALHLVPRHFGWPPRWGIPRGNCSAPCKPRALNLHQGQILECLLHPECRGGSWVVHEVNVDHFVCSRRPAGRWRFGAAR